MTNEVIDYCSNEACGAEIYFGQACLVAKLGAKTIVAGKGG